MDDVLRRLGGTGKSWRTDRMATVVYPGTDRLRPEAAAAAKHYGVTVAVCPANRPQRKGVVEKAIGMPADRGLRPTSARERVYLHVVLLDQHPHGPPHIVIGLENR